MKHGNYKNQEGRNKKSCEPVDSTGWTLPGKGWDQELKQMKEYGAETYLDHENA